MLGPGPHTVGGILGATGQGAAMGGTMGAGVGAVSSVGRDPCFPTGTPILMADGTTKPIENVAVGDHVACTDPDTGQPTTSTVTKTFTHEHTPGSPDSKVTMAAPLWEATNPQTALPPGFTTHRSQILSTRLQPKVEFTDYRSEQSFPKV